MKLSVRKTEKKVKYSFKISQANRYELPGYKTGSELNRKVWVMEISGMSFHSDG